MDDRLDELSVRALIERLATSDPVPGGGSAAALAGAMGAALIHMVVSLTAGREAGTSDDALTEIGTAAAQWQSELINLAELDANAYAAVVNARRLPRETELERQARDVQLAAAVHEATRAPLETLRAATAVLALAEQLAAIGTARAISDVGVGALLATAAARGAALNVRINLPDLHDDALRGEAEEALSDAIPRLLERERAVVATVEARLP